MDRRELLSALVEATDHYEADPMYERWDGAFLSFTSVHGLNPPLRNEAAAQPIRTTDIDDLEDEGLVRAFPPQPGQGVSRKFAVTVAGRARGRADAARARDSRIVMLGLLHRYNTAADARSRATDDLLADLSDTQFLKASGFDTDNIGVIEGWIAQEIRQRTPGLNGPAVERGVHDRTGTVSLGVPKPHRSGRPIGDGPIDVFISHASEDKAAVATPLAEALEERGWRVWLDTRELKVGDRLEQGIMSALARTRFGVVVLSPTFFAKPWTKRELEALSARDVTDKVLLPVWHEMTREEILTRNPFLANVLGVSTAKGIKVVADALHEALLAASAKSQTEPRPHPVMQSVAPSHSPNATGDAPVENTEALLLLGVQLREKGDLLAAEMYLRRAVVAGDQRGLAPLGATLLDLGRAAEAEPYLDVAGALEDDAARMLHALALQALGRLDEAEAELRRVVDGSDAA